MRKIQQDMAERALELLALPVDGRPRFILDLGCGSGLSGAVISASGHYWVGIDISDSMLSKHMEATFKGFVKCLNILDVAKERLEEDLETVEAEPGQSGHEVGQGTHDYDFEGSSENTESDSEDYDESGGEYDEDDFIDPHSDTSKAVGLLQGDMGEGAPFRAGTFDGCISISALQWLCHSNRAHENPKGRLTRLFNTLFSCLSRGARAVFQFYPETSSQIDLILACAMKAGFTGGLVIDYPHSTRAKKYYLCLMTGPVTELPKALEHGASDQHVSVDKRSRKRGRHDSRSQGSKKDKAWVMKKKEAARKRGEQVKSDSKYTARRRRIKF